MDYTFATLLLCATAIAIVITARMPVQGPANSTVAAVEPAFDTDGRLLRPAGFRRWVYIGAPLTPDALNGGAAGFPEFHNVYVGAAVYDHYRRHGNWPPGTMIVRELQLALPGDRRDGSRLEAAGRGYYPGRLQGLQVSVKDPQRFPDTNGWGFFDFGRHAPPYADSAAEAPVAACAGCHIASAHDDMVFSGFYRQLRLSGNGGSIDAGE